MSDTAITLELPRLFATTAHPVRLSPRLTRIVERNRDHGLEATLFAIGVAAFAALAAAGIFA